MVHFWLVWLKWMRIGLLHVHYTQACTHACIQFARWKMAKFWNFPSLIARLGFIALNANIAPFAIQLLWQTSATITIKGRKQINSEQCMCNVCFIISTEYNHSLSPINSIMKEGTERHLKKKWAKNESQPFERSSSFCWRNTQWNMNISSLGGYFHFF